MKFDVVISNPPYTNTNKFCRVIKQIECDNNIILVPLSSMRDITYKSAEWVDFPEIGIGNIHIIDLNGNINEYFSSNPAPFWSNDEKDKCFIEYFHAKKIVPKSDSRMRIKTEWKDRVQKFIECFAKSSLYKIYNGKIYTKCFQRDGINKLWELYCAGQLK